MPNASAIIAGSTRGLESAVGGARDVLTSLAEHGCRDVMLDVTDPDLRPKRLDRGGRRDLAALLGRLELRCVGLDLLIPPGHFAAPAHVDRAVQAVLDAVVLAGELRSLGAAVSQPVVGVAMNAGAQPQALAAILNAGERHGVRVATLPGSAEHPCVGVWLSALRAADVEPVERLMAVGDRLGMVRVEHLDQHTESILPGVMAVLSVLAVRAPLVIDASEAADPMAFIARLLGHSASDRE
jgi:hypothetical protein